MVDEVFGWESRHRCREFLHAGGRISRMSLNPLNGIWIALQRVAVSFIGKEVT